MAVQAHPCLSGMGKMRKDYPSQNNKQQWKSIASRYNNTLALTPSPRPRKSQARERLLPPPR
eukprot:scaffold7500_cov127-Isochrysis_galbana.AAC.13